MPDDSLDGASGAFLAKLAELRSRPGGAIGLVPRPASRRADRCSACVRDGDDVLRLLH